VLRLPPSSPSPLSPRRRTEKGQVLIFTALVFMFVMVGLLATVANMLELIDSSAQERSAAYAGAVAGGQQVDPSAVSGALTASVPLAGDAGQVCQQEAGLADPGSQVSVSCSVSSGVVTATVCEAVQYPVSLLGLGGTVCDTERAGPAFGTVTPG